jgi:hypothetical protein
MGKIKSRCPIYRRTFRRKWNEEKKKTSLGLEGGSVASPGVCQGVFVLRQSDGEGKDYMNILLRRPHRRHPGDTSE